MKQFFSLLLGLSSSWCLASGQTLEQKPDGIYFEKFQPVKAKETLKLLLKKGDRLAICGDSITQQRMYSRIMETYLTVCVPELEITARQFGWGGETAPKFLARMNNDCLRFDPTIATTCYGMNDYQFQPYKDSIGQQYRESQTAIVEAFKAHGTRVLLGSPGCIGVCEKFKGWDADSVKLKNLSLCTLRNIDIEIAGKTGVAFADVFWPMLTAGYAAQQQHGADYAIAGKRGVHPNWAGHLVMAYAFLNALGLQGEIGTITVDLKSKQAQVSNGHQLIGMEGDDIKIKSTRYPFCATGDVASDNSIRSGMSLVPFNEKLNRLILVVKNATAPRYRVSWGGESRSYTVAELAKGVNLANDFPVNPFSSAFAKVDAAVAAKQEYETRQIKVMFRGPGDKDEIERQTESVRTPLAAAIQEAFIPVTHTVGISAE